MRSAYRVLALLVVAGVFIQAGAIAFAWFDVLNDLEQGGTFTKDSDGNVGHGIHATVGMMVMPLLALVLFIVSFFTKIPGAVKWAGFVLLAVVVQIALAFGAFVAAPVIGFLHGMNALVIVGLAFAAVRHAKAFETAAAAPQGETVGANAV